MNLSVFEYKDYKAFIKQSIDASANRLISRSGLARHLNCQPAFVSQVLNNKANFSLEHGISVSRFLQLNEQETRYFLLLLSKERAGTQSLVQHYEKQMKELLRAREVIRSRISHSKELSPEEQAKYYSSWYYSAVHILTAIPAFRTPQKISSALEISLQKASEALEFLQQLNLVEKKQNEYFITKKRIHLGTESRLLQTHHQNWRTQAIHQITNKDTQADDTHYSLVTAISREDATKIRSMILECLEKSEKIITQSPEESLYGFLFDFYEITSR